MKEYIEDIEDELCLRSHEAASELICKSFNQITESYFPNHVAEEVIDQLEEAIQFLKLYRKLGN